MANLFTTLRPRILLVIPIMVLLSAAVQADVIVPHELATFEGNSNSIGPFFDFCCGLRFQEVYNSGEFSRAGLITGVVFRPDGAFPTPFSTIVNGLRVELSTTTLGPDTLQPVFAQNVGADHTVVFNDSLRLSSSATGTPGGPLDFDISVPFTTPFFFDPAAGNLLLDVRSFGAHALGFRPPLDGSEIEGDAISTVIAENAFDSTGLARTIGVVTRFQTDVQSLPSPPSPTPEPWSLLLLTSGLVGVYWKRRQL